MKRLLFSALFVTCSAFAQTIPWAFETTPIPSTQAGDPAFLFQPTPAPGTSFIIGTDKVNPGLYAWPPAPGAFPNVIPLGIYSAADARGPVLVAVSSFTSTVSVFVLVNGNFVELDTAGFNVSTPRHVALRQTPAGQFEMFVDTSSNVVERYQLVFLANGRVGFNTLPSISVVEPPSGLAVDDRTGQLYIGQPSRGVMVAAPPMIARWLISIDAGQLGSAVGGVDLYQAADGGAFLLTTAPNEGVVKVHSRDGGFLASLQFTGDGGGMLGRPEELDVFEPPSPGFPRGVLVLQDALTANYKVVSLAAINDVFPLPEPFVPNPSNVDAGNRPAVDAGPLPDAGPPDGGSGTDGGAGADGGTGGGTDGGVDAGMQMGTGGGIGGTPVGPAPGVQPMEPSCGCTGGPFALLPALLSLWFVRRRRTDP